MKKTDVLIIGGSAAGLVAALTGKSSWPEKHFTLIKKQEQVMIPCGIPYIFGTLESSDQNLLPVDKMMAANGIESLVGEVIEIDKSNKKVVLKSGEEIGYDKLVIGTGSLPSRPKWLKGADKQGVFVIPKDKIYLDEMRKSLEGMKKIVVIGAGFIGVEFSDELKKLGMEVTLVEKMPEILNQAFDPELSVKIQKILTDRGVNVITGNGIAEVTG
ncbi:MAG: FAD/NAD(P)-binding oxidoreductase, partial [Bacteroidales bacterium]